MFLNLKSTPTNMTNNHNFRLFVLNTNYQYVGKDIKFMNSFIKSNKIKFYKCDKTYDADFCINVIFGTAKSFHLIVIIHMHMNTDFCLIRVKTMLEEIFSDVKSALVQLLFLF